MPPPEPVQSAPIASSADKTKSSGIDVFHIRHDFNKETYGKSWKLGDDLHLVVGDVVMATLPMQSAQQTSPKWMHGRIIGSLQSQVRWAFIGSLVCKHVIRCTASRAGTSSQCHTCVCLPRRHGEHQIYCRDYIHSRPNPTWNQYV